MSSKTSETLISVKKIVIPHPERTQSHFYHLLASKPHRPLVYKGRGDNYIRLS